MMGNSNGLVSDGLLEIFSFDKLVKTVFNKNIRHGTVNNDDDNYQCNRFLLLVQDSIRRKARQSDVPVIKYFKFVWPLEQTADNTLVTPCQ